MTRRVLASCVLAMTLAAPLASAQAPEPATVLANVHQFYADANQLTARFRQTVTNTTFQTSKTSDGRLWVRKPSELRWDYLERRNGAVTVVRTFIFNGQTFWLVNHTTRQIFQNQTQSSALPAAMSFLTGGAGLASQFAVALDTSGTYGTKGTLVLELTPRQPSAPYTHLFFVVDPGDWHVKESIVVDSSGDTNDLRLYTPDLATPVTPALFQVNPAALPTYTLTRIKPPRSGASGPGAIAPAPPSVGSAATPSHTP